MAEASNPTEAVQQAMMAEFAHLDAGTFEARFVFGVSAGVSSLFVLSRLLAKWISSQGWNFEDFICVVAYGFHIAASTVAVFLSAAIDPSLISANDLTVSGLKRMYVRMGVLPGVFYCVSSYFVKLLLFLLYLRLFKPHTITRRLVYVGIAICTVIYLAFTISLATIWNPGSTHSIDLASLAPKMNVYMAKEVKVGVAQSVFGTLSDIYLLLTPIYCICQLQMPFRRKIGACAIFGVGLIAVACSILSLVYRVKYMATSDLRFLTPTTIAGVSEICAGLVCACMPFVPILVRSIKLPQSWSKGSTTTTSAPPSDRHAIVAKLPRARHSELKSYPTGSDDADFQWLKLESQTNMVKEESRAAGGY